MESQYRKGYVAGYRDGVRDAVQGKIQENAEKDLLSLPVEVMQISTRARNCLKNVDCETIADVVALDADRILAIRRLGPKSAAEVARWLDGEGIGFNAWYQYL